MHVNMVIFFILQLAPVFNPVQLVGTLNKRHQNVFYAVHHAPHALVTMAAVTSVFPA